MLTAVRPVLRMLTPATVPEPANQMAERKPSPRRLPLCGAVVLALVGVLSVTAAAAWATAPDKNGRIVFRRFFDDAQTWGALFTANPDGTAVRQVTRPAKGVLDTEPDWSPDGSRIAFEHGPTQPARGTPSPLIYTVNANGRGLNALVACTRGCAGQQSPAWSPDGSKIAFSSGGRTHEEIWVVNADGTALQQITRPSGFYDQQPQWSPDGKRIVVQRVDPRRRGVALYVVNSDGTRERRLTPWALGAGDHPDWSPDGRRILFRSNVNGPSTVSANLYTIRPDGTGLRQLTHARGGTVQHLSASFSPDGKWITFARTATGKERNADVFVMRANGTGVRNLTRSRSSDSAPDWGPR
jgi:TolB protein